MKKNTLLVLSTFFLTIGFLASCGGGSSTDDKTITIKVYKGGYDTAWLYQLKENFEAVYSKEGYKVNIKTPDSTLKANDALADMRLPYSKNHTDLYFVQDVSPLDVNADKASYGEIAEVINDVYESNAISYSGVEENVKIKDKIKTTYNTSISYNNNYYSTLWASSPCGLVINKKVLQKFSLSIPKTTDELKNCYQTIINYDYQGKKEERIYPISWAGGNACGYALFCLYPNLAQILGKNGYNKFMALQDNPNADEPSKEDINNGWQIYNSEDIYSPIRLLRYFYDKAVSYPGATDRTHTDCHGDIALGEAAFTFDGEFFFNEIKTDYKNYLNDITFANTPLNSDLGVKLGITDAKLSEIAGLIDQDKTIAEIVALSGVSEDIASTVYEARNAYYEKANHNAYIRSGSTKVDIAKLFLRMACSDDFGQTFNEVANASFPYSSTNKITSNYEFVQNVSKVVNRKDSWGVSNLNPSKLRIKASIKVYHPYNDEIVKSLVAADDLETFINSIKSYMTKKENWDKFMKDAGYDPD